MPKIGGENFCKVFILLVVHAVFTEQVNYIEES